METGKIKFTAGLDGVITANVISPYGVELNLTGCNITLKIAYKGEENALLTLNNPTINESVCIFNLTPSDTEILDYGEYDAQLIIIDNSNKKRATEKVNLAINKIIN